MTENFSIFNKQLKLSEQNRENLSFVAPNANEDPNFFTQAASQNKNAQNSYDSIFNSLDRADQDNQLFNLFTNNQKLEDGKEDSQSIFSQLLAQENAREVKTENLHAKKEKAARVKQNVNVAENYSKAAVTEFINLVENKKLTAADISELYLRCSREISINAPEAWASLDKEYSNALASAHTPSNTMNAQSRNAISNFKGAINSSMTADEMNETFLRYIREVSTKHPDAWKEMESILANYVVDAHRPDTSMDAQSRNAIVNFKQTLCNSMTRDEMVETFLRFSREVSINFPDAGKELESILNNQIGNAYKANDKSDDKSELAVTNFKTSILSEMTEDDLCELYIRFSRDISIKYPDKKNELTQILNNSLPNAFRPDTTIDKDSEELIDKFRTLITTQEFDKDTFENTFANYFKQIGLNLSKARKIMTDLKGDKYNETENKTFSNTNEAQGSHKINSEFEKLVEKANTIDYNVQVATGELQGIYNEDAQEVKKAEIYKLMDSKYQEDNKYHELISAANSNDTASHTVKDNYLFNMTADIVAPDKKEIVERDSNDMSKWDMLRTIRRDELKGMMNAIPQEELVDILYALPKTSLLNGLEMLPHQQQIDVIANSRFEDAMLRGMPRKQLVEMLPDAYEMLPLLMMLGKTENGAKNGAELIEDTVVNTKKVEPPQNQTRQQEELLPFMMEQMLEKTPRYADAKNPVIGKNNVNNVIAKANQTTNLKADGPAKQNPITKVEELSGVQLSEVVKEAMASMDESDLNSASAAQRGGSEEFMNFLQDLKKVDSVDAGKMAMSNLYNSQAQGLKTAVIPALSDKELIKINKNYGNDPKDMIRELPSYAVMKQLHDLNKVQIVDGYKKVDKDMIMNRIQDVPSQTLARLASETIDRQTVFNHFANSKGVAA